ncbi:cysteine proteinase, partial [Paraphaeosphaeria sporulosa]
LTSHDFGTLLPHMFNGDAKGWLNDNIINEYLEILVNYAQRQEGYVYVRGKGGSTPPVHAFKSQWYTSMKGNPSGTARWARPMHLFGEKLLACNLVLIPICHHSHWRLIAIKPKDRLIEYYDSLHGSGREYTQLAKEWVREVLQKQFVEEEWSICTNQRSKAQANASDCGIFTLLNALVLLRGEEHNRVLVTNGMDDARLRVAATLL